MLFLEGDPLTRGIHASTQLYKAFSLDVDIILTNQVWRYNCFHWKQL